MRSRARRLRQRSGLSSDSDESASAAGRLRAARGTLIGVIQDEGGSEISLRDPQGNDLNGGTLPAGTYTVQVDDTSTLHNFHLEGPGVQCVPPSDCMTDVAGFGRETWLVNFTPGTVTYHCDPHPDLMGSFTVVEGPPPPPPPPPPATPTSTSTSTATATSAATATASTTASTATAPELHRQRGLRRHHQPPQLVHAQQQRAARA